MKRVISGSLGTSVPLTHYPIPRAVCQRYLFLMTLLEIKKRKRKAKG